MLPLSFIPGGNAGKQVIKEGAEEAVETLMVHKLKEEIKDASGNVVSAADQIYKRPSYSVTKAQRKVVQGKPCVDCGTTADKMIPDHINPLVKEHYENGKIDINKMRDVNSVQPQCPTCSAKQGGKLSQYSKMIKRLINESK